MSDMLMTPFVASIAFSQHLAGVSIALVWNNWLTDSMPEL